jgi:hypothetical protein
VAGRLNAYLADNDEYRAILRHLLHLGGHITYTTKSITVALNTPATPKITRALRRLLDELSTTPTTHPQRPPPHHPQDQNGSNQPDRPQLRSSRECSRVKNLSAVILKDLGYLDR